MSATLVLIFLRACACPDPTARPTRIAWNSTIGYDLRTEAGQLQIQPGEPARAQASLRATSRTLNALLEYPAALDRAMADGRVAATGDLSALRRLLHAATNPPPVTG